MYRKEELRVKALISDMEGAVEAIETSCGMTFQQMGQLLSETDMLAEAFVYAVKQAARKNGLDFSGFSYIPGYFDFYDGQSGR
ncbi:hypothetical protein [Paraburkholderia sp. CI3]|uniref:hypothetical protein n=1 Tax=Paraburkholderia sp. CI3 TaxID=2991060 RepID=UPI003D221DF8